MESLKEHIIPIISLMGLLFTGLVAALGIIAKQFRNEMQRDREQREETTAEFSKKIDKIEGYLEKITEELFERMRKAEASLSTLWAEHRVIKEFGTCHQGHKSEDKS